MAKMKNLANCKPSEFLKQTNKIRKSVEKWLTITDILNIRKRQAALPDGASMEDIEKANQEQARKNLSAMLDSIMDEHPNETLEILALACFVDPKDVNKHPTSEYLGALSDLLNDKNVIAFFTSLVGLGQRLGTEE